MNPELARSASRLVLVGFMGAGKTAVGADLAARLGWRHLDLDAMIEAAAGTSVARIFAERGEAEFRRLETEATREAAEHRCAVVSTGGGWVENPAHWETLRDGAVVAWLRVRVETVLRRVAAQGDTRPLLAGAEPERRARELLARREPLYAAADLTLDTDDLTPAEVAGELLNRVRARLIPA